MEFLGRNKVFKRHLPADFNGVPILVSPEASLKFWKPRLKSDQFDFAKEFVSDGCVVWDIGSSIGLLSVAAAQRAGSNRKVIAVEADIWAADLLRRSAALQPVTSAPIQVIPVAVADSLGIAAFNIARSGRVASYLSEYGGSPKARGIRETFTTVTVTLDWLLEQGIPAPQVLKIDVEGAAAHVMKGAERVLAESQPVVLCESHNPARDVVTEILHRHGYTLFDWESNPRIKIGRVELNTLAIPPLK